MKKTVSILALSLSVSLAAAQSAQLPQDAELLSAQIAYRAALKNHTDYSGKMQTIQSRLDNAKRRLQEAQSDVQRGEQQLSEAQNAQSTASSVLQAASVRLDTAWAAARGGR